MTAAEPIAIVGVGCEYPDAPTPERLWENVLAGRRAFRRIPDERLRLEDYAEAIYSTEAAVIEGYTFDRLAFRVSGPSFRAADLTHWLALDVAYRALADAGFPDGAGLPRDTTAVILGNTLTGEFARAGVMRLRWPYVRRVVDAALGAEGVDERRRGTLLARIEADYLRPFEPPGDETLAGGLSNTIGGRICNHLDLHGGGYTVDGACCASLLAVITACERLAQGDADVVLAGGVDLSLDPFELVGFARVGALARDEMRVYDARSAGFWPGEGCGVVVLMRLRDALADHRRVHAIVRGHGISSDGAGGLTRPEFEGQRLALRRAYARAGLDPASVALFEGHGTGTAVGDATELRVLAAARDGARGPAAAIGSIKANIGHTKAAAGVAGLLKATLALRQGVIPPTTGAERPHPELERAGALRIARDVEPWPDGLAVRAGVSAMGFGGINTHVVLDGPDQDAPRHGPTPREARLASSAQDAELFAFSGDSAQALVTALARVRSVAAALSRAELADLAATLALGPLDRRWRAAIVARTAGELSEGLDALLTREAVTTFDVRAGVFAGQALRAPRIGLLLPGQGSPANVDGGLFRRRFRTLVDDLYSSPAVPRQAPDTVATEVAQPAIVTGSLAAVRVLSELGIEGDVALGHSLGELSALSWAGVFDASAAQRIAAARGRAMAELSTGRGAMLGLSLPASDAERLAAGLGLVVAGLNAPARTVMAGDVAAIEALATRAHSRDIQAVRLRVSHAFHSPLVAPAAAALGETLDGERFARPTRRVISTVTGAPIEPGADVRALLCEQVTAPVRFHAALSAAATEVDLLLEAGPGQVLSTLARETTDVPTLALDAGGPSLAGVLKAVAAAWTFGAPVRIDALFERRFTRPFDLDRPPSFFASPCEHAPLPETDVVVAALPEVIDEHAPASAGALDPLDVVAQLVAERAEMPREAITADSRMLDHLHLTSIVVGEIAVAAARRLGVPVPAAHGEFANATIAELSAALVDARSDGEAAPVEPPGVGSWLRPLVLAWVERERPRVVEAAETGRWRVFAPPAHPLADGLTQALAAAGGEGIALCVPDAPERHLPLLLEAAQAALSAPRLLVVQASHATAAGLARSVHLEAPGCDVAVVTLPLDATAPAVAAQEVLAVSGFAEVRYEGNRRLEPVVRRLSPTAGPLPLGSDDVVLVTGGARGIAVECMLRLARASGAALAIVGRGDPSDPEIAANRERLEAAGIRVRYKRADVTDPAAVRAAVQELGSVTAVVHAAGTNEPRRLAETDAALLARTLGPKVAGLRNVLAAVDRERLRLLVTFGSIIARTGMRGDAHYALANEWQTALTEQFAAAHPTCTCLAFESSVWAAVGMGERLGSVSTLARQGVQAIEPDAGAALLEAMLRTRERPAAVIACGRFGRPPTLRMAPAEVPLLRFLEHPVVHYPGIELVADSEISDATDAYLAEHVLDGDPLMPAVIGLEAMAQGVAGLVGRGRAPVFEDLRLVRPIVVPPGEATTVRVAALADDEHSGTIALRCERTAFAVDHFTARWRLAEGPPAPHADLPLELGAERVVNVDPDELYGGLLFQSGRFRRLRGYRVLSAVDCVAEIGSGEPSEWFGPYLPPELLLSDPGARDSVLHALQACLPHVRVVPVAARAVWPATAASSGPWVVHARERERSGDEYVYDVVVTDPGGAVRERWDRLRLRAVAPIETGSEPWPAGLVTPLAERHLPTGVHVALSPRETIEARRDAARRAVGQAVGAPVVLRHRPDGRPEVDGLGGSASIAHAGGLTLAVVGPGVVACDLERVAHRQWRELLGGERVALASTLARERGEDLDASATRVWAAGECLAKAGVPPEASLTLTAGRENGGNGWLALASGRFIVTTYVGNVREADAPLAFAFLTEAGDARV